MARRPAQAVNGDLIDAWCVALPAGWRTGVVERDAPLEVGLFGGGDNCYAVVLNDSQQQIYHQFSDADGVFP